MTVSSGMPLIRLIFVVAWLVVAPVAAEVADQVAAAVDDEVVTFSDLRWLVQYRGLEVPSDPKQQRDFYLTLLDQVIDQKLIAAEAEQTPIIQITPEKVQAQIEAYKKRFPIEEDFQKKLDEMQMSLYEFRQLVRRQLAVNEFVETRFKPFIIVLPNEIEEYYQQEFLPQLKQQNQPIPSLEVVEESIRQILTEQKTNQEMDRWLGTARRRAHIVNLLFRENRLAPNLPPSLAADTKLQTVPIESKSK